MTNLLLATSDHASAPLHAAAPGDARSVCGHDLDQILTDAWDAAPARDTCDRCQHAVAVLRLIRAV
jgi:hypothetical protein